MLKNLQKLRSNNKGFTIIEVMIVLAIAGMIILVVLLAIPALQRNARNTAIKNDASAITGGISEFASNNDGAIPTAAGSSYASGVVTLNNGVPVTAATAKVQGSTAVTFGQATVAAYTPTAGNIYVDFGAKCPPVVSGLTVTPVASTRATAVIYATEAAGGLQARCLDS